MFSGGNMKIAAYGGTFDPPTNGHMWMIEQGSKLFDKLIVVVASHPDKKTTFSPVARGLMLTRLCLGFKNVRVDVLPEDKYFANFAYNQGARYILRGIRDEVDFSYESRIANINHRINSNIQTVFLKPDKELTDVSSSMIKGLVGRNGWEKLVAQVVPPTILKLLKAGYSDE